MHGSEHEAVSGESEERIGSRHGQLDESVLPGASEVLVDVRLEHLLGNGFTGRTFVVLERVLPNKGPVFLDPFLGRLS